MTEYIGARCSVGDVLGRIEDVNRCSTHGEHYIVRFDHPVECPNGCCSYDTCSVPSAFVTILEN